MSSELSVSPEDILKATEDYTRSSKVGPLFQDLALQTFKARPDEPSKFLLELLVRRHPDVAAELANKYIDKGKSEATQEEKKKLCVQITHEDLCTQQYLTEKVGLDKLCEQIAENLVSQKPPPGQAINRIIQVLQDMLLQFEEQELREDPELKDLAS